MPNSSGGSSWPRGTDRRGGRWSGSVGQLRRETEARFTCRQAAPAPLYAEDHDESRPSPLTALRAADQALLTHLLRLDPIMIPTDHQVPAFCRMVRQHRRDEFDAWVTAVRHTGVQELRAFVKGLLKDEAAVRAGLSLVWSNGLVYPRIGSTDLEGLGRLATVVRLAKSVSQECMR
jgi:transposase